MHELLSSFLSNDSSFGKLMTRLGIIIGANLMFVLFSLPLVTAGAAWAALLHVMLKTLRGDGVLNPFKQFWAGFRGNFRQATIVWIAVLALAVFGYFDMRICMQAGGWIAGLRYPIAGFGILMVIILIYLYPTMAAFEDTIPGLIRSSIYFVMRRPWKLPVMLFFHVFPLYLTYTDAQTLPLYAFLWCFFGYGAIAMLSASLLLPEFRPFLPLVDICGDFVLDENGQKQKPEPAGNGSVRTQEGEGSAAMDSEMAGPAQESAKTEAQIREEMKRLGM